MKRDETIQFLTMRGWEIYSKPNNRVVLNKKWNQETDSEDLCWITIEEALEYEKIDNPSEFSDYELINNLDNKTFQIYKDYLDE